LYLDRQMLFKFLFDYRFDDKLFNIIIHLTFIHLINIRNLKGILINILLYCLKKKIKLVIITRISSGHPTCLIIIRAVNLLNYKTLMEHLKSLKKQF